MTNNLSFDFRLTTYNLVEQQEYTQHHTLNSICKRMNRNRNVVDWTDNIPKKYELNNKEKRNNSAQWYVIYTAADLHRQCINHSGVAHALSLESLINDMDIVYRSFCICSP